MERPALSVVDEDPVIEAISGLTESDSPVQDEWHKLDELSSGTTFEGIEASPGGIVSLGGGRVEASGTIYVTLNYGRGEDGLSMSDAYPATVMGHFEDGQFEVDELKVDTSSFYGEEED